MAGRLVWYIVLTCPSYNIDSGCVAQAEEFSEREGPGDILRNSSLVGRIMSENRGTRISLRHRHLKNFMTADI